MSESNSKTGEFPNNPQMGLGNQSSKTNHQIELVRSYFKNSHPKKIPGVKFAGREIQFANQGRFEEVFIIVRSHWSVNLGWAFRAVMYSIFPLIAIFIVSFFRLDEYLKFVKDSEWYFLLLFYYSIIVTNTFRAYIDWYFDPYFVTNERIIHYDFVPFSRYKIQEAYFDRIEDVKEVSAGFIANLFGYGDIKINTASEKGEFEFKKVPNPTLIRNIITDLSRINRSFNNK